MRQLRSPLDSGQRTLLHSTPHDGFLSGEAPTRPKEAHMSGKALYVKFVLLMLVLGTLALALGSDPWGPN